MFTLTLILATIVIWAMGYRFYGKFLRLWILPDPQLPLRSQAAESLDKHPLVIGTCHAAVSTGILSIVGASIAMVWGWIPGFLWVVVGGVAAGTVLALGSMWISVRGSGQSLAAQVFEIAGLPAALLFFFLGIILLVLTAAVTGVLIGHILDTRPDATWAFMAFIAIGVAWARSSRRLILLPVGLGLYALTLYLGQIFPLSLSGDWILDLGNHASIEIRPELIWAALAFYVAYRSAQQPLPGASQGRGVFAILAILVVICLFVAGNIIADPNIDAPQFQGLSELPPTPVLLFLVVTGGALSGICAYISSGCTAPQLSSPQQAVPTSFAGTGIACLLAVLVIAALATGFDDQDEWLEVYGIWPSEGGIVIWIDLLVHKIGAAMAAVGVPLGLSTTLVASALVALALSMLESLLRLLSTAVGEFVEDFESEVFRTPIFKHRASLALGMIVALGLTQTNLSLQHWLLAGIANQWFACAALLLLGLTLSSVGRTPVFAWVPLAIVFPFAAWGTGWVMWSWLQQERWLLLGTSGVICALSLLFALISLVVWAQPAKSEPDQGEGA